MRLFGAVAAVAALNFFTVNPKVSVQVKCKSVIDSATVDRVYQQVHKRPTPRR